MPLSPEHKQRSRQKILKSAAELFARQGYAHTSIDQVMQHARLTRGAFYAHFSSKSDLYKEAIIHAARSSALLRQKPAHMTEQEWLDTLVQWYLSMEHVTQKTGACPIAFLATDVAVREPQVRSTYTRVFNNMNKLISGYTKNSLQDDDTTALAIMAMMIGGVAVGRALNDRDTTEKLLEACHLTVRNMLAKD